MKVKGINYILLKLPHKCLIPHEVLQHIIMEILLEYLQPQRTQMKQATLFSEIKFFLKSVSFQLSCCVHLIF